MSAARSRATTVSPPPGRVLDLDLAAHRLDEPLRDGQPEPHALVRARVAEPLERQEQPLPLVARDAGPAIDDAHVDDAVDDARGDARRRAGRREAHRVLDHVRERPLEQARDRRARAAASPARRARRRRRRAPRLSSAAGTTSSSPTGDGADVERAGLQAAHVEQVADERVQPVGLLVDRVEELAPRLRRPLDVVAGAGSSPTP